MSIFGEALECASPAEQTACLDRACAGDTALRARVEALLRAHQQVGHFLERTLVPADGSPTEAPGTVLGPYRLVAPLGAGGFGIVYRAEQQQPVRRQVALKVLRPEMASRQVIARFELERQALALMNHTHIARVLDAGEAPPAYAGGPPRPYFVMELVEGVPVTDFCDRERLTPRERLGLFVNLCQAVQHAHQKGIIHRDLKPSNVLVSLQDGVPVVKVIDFGIAKALEQPLTDKTLVTGVAQVIGTPLYMSPEQAEAGAVDIDTRSDIYSLGVLLYELLTGTTPFDRERLREASFDELRRIIREEEPPRPSTRMKDEGRRMTDETKRTRRTRPNWLGPFSSFILHPSSFQELDWIVMKCLEKDRSRRYQTADELARDVARYLADEPVEACPPSAGYRLGKFLRKHRRPLLTAAAFLSLLLAGGLLAGWQALREAEAVRDRAVEQAQRSEAVRNALDRVRALREDARQAHDSRKWAQAREQAQRALALVENGLADEALVAQVRQVQEELDEEKKNLRFVADLEAARLAKAEMVAGQNRFAVERALPLYRKAFRTFGLPVGEGDPATAATRLQRRPLEVRQAVSAALDDWLGLAAGPKLGVHEPHFGWLSVLAAAELEGGGMREMQTAWQEPDLARRREALKRLAATADPHQWPAALLTRLSLRLQAVRAPGSAVGLLRRAWRQYPADFWVNADLGVLLSQTEPQHWEEAARHLTAAVALHTDSPGAHVNLGNALAVGEQHDEAIACYRRAIDLDRAYAPAHNNLGNVLQAKGQTDLAIVSYQKAIALDSENAMAHNNLGNALQAKGQTDLALVSYRKALALNPEDALTHNNLGNALQAKGQTDLALESLHKALALDPNFALAHYNLGHSLSHGKQEYDAAIVSYQRALELDPNLAVAHFGLSQELFRKGEVNNAIAGYRQGLVLAPKNALAHASLGIALQAKGQTDLALVSLRKALALDPKQAVVHTGLGKVLQAKGQADLPILSYRKATLLAPNSAEAHYNLGQILSDAKQEYDAAIACYRTAIELDPKHAMAHFGLAHALSRKGQADKAIAGFRLGLTLAPNYALAHFHLGVVLSDAKQQYDAAIACYRRAIELDPNLVRAHFRLGRALSRKGEIDKAIVSYRTCVALDPNIAAFHCNLGLALVNKGLFTAALVALRRGHELGTRQPGWTSPSGKWVKDCERFVQLDDLLAATREVKARPAGPAECLELADFCRQLKQCPAAAVRFYTDAFTAEPKLADDLRAAHRYRAAQAAALAGCGQGKDAAGLSAAERARLRRQALEWLRADLALRTKQLEAGGLAGLQARQAVAAPMQQWLSEPSLAGVRDAIGLAKLPAEERSLWQAFWADVTALRTRAGQAQKQSRS
jgi:tetratricopeptide (TPR) repeat protein/serine/threonine protein kinase